MEKKNYGENCIGQVIRIIDKVELIINVGKDSLTVGDKIQIYDPGDELYDLDGSSLGLYEKIKAELTVTYTSEYYSVCSDTFEETVSIFDSLNYNLSRTKTFTNNLNVREEDIKPLHSQFSSIINIGDPVKKV